MVNMLTFGFLPYVQAQTELLLGMKPKKKFNVTEKVLLRVLRVEKLSVN